MLELLLLLQKLTANVLGAKEGHTLPGEVAEGLSLLSFNRQTGVGQNTGHCQAWGGSYISPHLMSQMTFRVMGSKL